MPQNSKMYEQFENFAALFVFSAQSKKGDRHGGSSVPRLHIVLFKLGAYILLQMHFPRLQVELAMQSLCVAHLVPTFCLHSPSFSDRTKSHTNEGSGQSFTDEQLTPTPGAADGVAEGS